MTLLSALLVSAVAADARAQDSLRAAMPVEDVPVGLLGPTGAVQLHPIRQAFVDVAARGQVTRPWIRVERHTANSWNSDTPLLVNGKVPVTHAADVHLEQLLVDMGVPLGPFLSAGARLGAGRIWGGGSIDSLVEGFHHDFQFYNFNREKAPQARTWLVVNGPGTPPVRMDSPRPLMPSPQLSLFARLLENRTTQLVARGVVQLPHGDLARALRMDAAEMSGGLSLFQRVRQLAAFFLSGHVLWHGNRVVGGLSTEPQLLVDASLEVRILPFLSIVAEDRIQSPLFFGRGTRLQESRALAPRATLVNAYFTPVNIITGGARLYLPDNSAVTVHVGEDFMFCIQCFRDRFSRETNAPDISLSLTLEQVLPRRVP